MCDISATQRWENGQFVNAHSAWCLFSFRAIAEKNQNKQGSEMRVLGIDPGLRNLGWGVIDVEGSRLSHVANGICHSSGPDLAARLLSLYEQLTDILHRFDPQAAAVEQTFVNKDGAGTLKLGVGHAAKEQVAHMVKVQLPGVVLAGPDAADALAIAICHAHHARSSDMLARAVARASA